MLEKSKDWDYFINLSGADYPVKTISYLESYLAERYPRNYAETFRIRPIFAPGEYHHENFSFAECDSYLFKVSPNVGTKNVEIVRGSQWFTFTRQFCEYVITDQLIVPKVVDFFSSGIFSDEGFFATILWNTPWNGTVVPRTTCLRWEKGVEARTGTICNHADNGDWCGWGPVTVNRQDLDEYLFQHNCFFARKFNIEGDWSVLRKAEWIYNKLSSKEDITEYNWRLEVMDANYDYKDKEEMFIEDTMFNMNKNRAWGGAFPPGLFMPN